MDIFQLKTRPVVLRRELFDHYSELGMDEQDLVILIKLIYAAETSNKQPSIEALRKGSTLDSREITTIIQHLIQLDLLELNVNKDEEGKFTEYMNLDPFYTKLLSLLKQQELKSQNKQEDNQFQQLFTLIEQIFARPLSPYEIETLNQWIDVDHHDISIIQAALDEAVGQNKLSFKYMDRILLNWKKNNVKTIDDTNKIREQFHKPKMKHTVKEVPKFDWLNGENLDDK
ncbi:DnaD domain-containing protein [Staphylococcus lugdunensis]|uniref:DNA replication protein DnaD n=1 Tax=Staphylococcus lugdunensis TaxID=28035 RepID=A0A133Q395_STALU|nr:MULTISPECIES: DnaD domain-containing protein [Staphylococcus]ADC87543.1 Chromosome replication initiation protein dnaD [Staphylococcus lugdunensis HKU09-01]AMG60681.1 DNA replication protein DnaD [Staphylococcus lugdunensis]AMG63133.1 DnaD domain protein [Staphylococcus lugdunensis]ARJ09310.1 DNA replication protein DnaD [Staphylococcus lugdunensis]ARJ11496.1 DNA replication protein DnaD [Staphylococcus lugdunensis]